MDAVAVEVFVTVVSVVLVDVAVVDVNVEEVLLDVANIHEPQSTGHAN